MKIFATYIWMDGTKPTALLRSKTKVINLVRSSAALTIADFPLWAFDGSSTNQAEGGDSDRLLKPVKAVMDPTRSNSQLVLCEVLSPNHEPHESNTRAILRETLNQIPLGTHPCVGFEQEYTMYSDGRPLGWPKNGRPDPQGPYYCSVGKSVAPGRILSGAHMRACAEADLAICGTNAEVMLGQWEYQIGGPDVSFLTACDDLILSRWILQRLGEDVGIDISYDPKPVQGDWNGAGCHTNFSTEHMRASGGLDHIKAACDALGKNVQACLDVYGDDYQSRLTGAHETCSYSEYRWGVGDRTASVRIPTAVALNERGYLEDRRPNANCDPYKVGTAILRSTLDTTQGEENNT